MIRLRARKIANIQPPGQDLFWTGPEKGDVLILGWGSTYGAIKAATIKLRADGVDVSACHVRYLNPLPQRLDSLMKEFKHVLMPELNLGQLRSLIRSKYLVDAIGLNKVRGQPFTIGEITEGVRDLLDGRVYGEEVKLADTVDAEEETDGGSGG